MTVLSIYSLAPQPQPFIETFPDNMLVRPGNLYVSVLGSPPPIIMWYYNNKCNGKIRVGEDGTLSIPSMMLKVTSWWPPMSMVVARMNWSSILNQPLNFKFHSS